MGLFKKKKEKTLEELANFGTGQDSFLSADSNRIVPYVEKNWTEQIDYLNFFEENQIVIFGDTDHRETGILGGLAKEMQKLKDAGVSYFAVEFPRDEENLRAIEEFEKSGDVSKLSVLTENTRTPVRLTRLFKSARDAGISIKLMDLPHSQRETEWDSETESKQRGDYMGFQIAELAETGEKIAVVTGYMHLKPDQIPEKLSQKEIKHKKIAVVTAGQRGLFPFDCGINMHGVSQAVQFCGLQKKSGYVELDSNYLVDGFIHFPRVELIESSHQLPGTVGEKIEIESEFPDASAEQGKLAIIDKNTSLPAFAYTFYKRVAKDVGNWEDTNRNKILEVVGTIKGLNLTQKLYLGLMIENYVRASARHGGGSITKIEFDAESKAIGIDTVDTCHYEFDPDLDYSSLSKHREVTLETLLTHFGFSDLLVKNIEDLPQTDIRPNMENSESTYKFLLLLSAYATHPERIDTHTTLDILRTDPKVSKDYIVQMDINDFMLSSEEQDLLTYTKKIENLEYLRLDAFVHFLDSIDDKKSKLFSRSAKLSKKQKKDMFMVFENFQRFYAFNIRKQTENSIMRARKNLDYMSTNDILNQLDSFEKGLQSYESGLMKLEETLEYFPKLYNAKYTPTYIASPNRGKELNFGGIVNQNMVECRNLLQELSEIRNSMDYIPVETSSQMITAVSNMEARK